MKKQCSISDCESEALARGYCNKHWKRWRSYGDPMTRHQGGAQARPARERFMEKFVQGASDECWPWISTLSVHGYGVMGEKIDGRNYQHKSNRLAYEIFVGPIPDGLMICHTCDNRACVNPKHLYAGTNIDNMRDVRERKRKRGIRHWRAKLTLDQVEQIVAEIGSARQVDIARKHGISQAIVSRLKRGESGYFDNLADVEYDQPSIVRSYD